MATPTTPPVRTCVLRVGLKCCRGCQTKAKRKLLSVSGVTAVDYNADQGLLTVSGDANPEMLLLKLTEWGKDAELVSVLGDFTASVPVTPEHSQTKTMEKKRPTKCWLLSCFGKRSSKVMVEPCRGPWADHATPPMLYPPRPQPIPAFSTPYPPPPPPRATPAFATPYPPPSSPYTAGMFRPPPPQSPPYFQQFPHMVNSRLHYPHLH
ncbi:hypothetical protein AALP_AA4G272700 [Arabis alpina]|uniref:HMA domain-containing protein n=1 Tax=Arabis alpina TaxID=50452 RepID=A0A087H607_ARAAL|nr:hypothetical protein AALP_AA4G272700 [Arabis alpina]